MVDIVLTASGDADYNSIAKIIGINYLSWGINFIREFLGERDDKSTLTHVVQEDGLYETTECHGELRTETYYLAVKIVNRRILLKVMGFDKVLEIAEALNEKVDSENRE